MSRLLQGDVLRKLEIHSQQASPGDSRTGSGDGLAVSYSLPVVGEKHGPPGIGVSTASTSGAIDFSLVML